MNTHVMICDDEQAELDYLTRLCEKWATERDITLRISTHPSAEAFLFSYEDTEAADILLLDIQMKAMDGVELARRVRVNDRDVQIIFITGFVDYMAEGYDVEALHYLIKPVKEEKLVEVLNRAVAKRRRAQRTILFPRAGGGLRIKADDILYAEVFSHTITLHCINTTEDFNMRITDMEKLLGDGFFRCHRSYIVSMRHVCRVTRTAMQLDIDNADGKPVELPLSRNLYDAANQAFIQCN